MENTKLKFPHKTNDKKSNKRHHSTPHKSNKGYERNIDSSRSHYHRRHSSHNRSKSKEGGRLHSTTYSFSRDNGRYVTE